MGKGISLALLAVGIVLIIWGINASESFASDVSRLFTGSATDKSMWFLAGGIVAATAGAVGLFRELRQ